MTEDNAPSNYCGRCGNPVFEGDRFCGVCGTAVLHPPEQAEQVIPRDAAASQGTAHRGRGRTLVWAVGLGALVVLLAGGALAAAALTGTIGPSSGTTDTASGGAPDGDSRGGAASSPPGDDPEATALTEETTASAEDPAPSDGAPHPAFDPLLPTLAEMTSAPIVLPSDLPPQFQDVAIDETSAGGEYAVLFLDDQAESREIVQPFVDAWVDGTLEGAPVVEGEPELPDYGPDFEVTSGQAMTFTDGALGAYNCYEPSSGTSGPFCVGAYTLGDYRYRLTLEGPTPPEEEIEWMLSSMAPAEVAPAEPTSASASPEPAPEDIEVEAEEAAGDYYRAAGVEDWAYTYENLDSETQSLFTRDEWFRKNQWFADNGEVVYHIDSVERLGTSGEPVVEVSLRLTYGDGSSSTRDTYFVYEGGGWKHAFGQEERDLFMPDATFEEFVAAQ